MTKPEDQARQRIDATLRAAGWLVQHRDQVNLYARRGIAVQEFPLASGYGFADYLLYVDGKAAGVIEAEKEGSTLIGGEVQSAKYSEGLPGGLPAHRRPLPFLYESTGVETHFTNGLDPDPRSRPIFAFHRPETLAAWLTQEKKDWFLEQARREGAGLAADPAAAEQIETFLSRVQEMPPLVTDGLWPAQIKAIENLERSLKENRPRALIQMATGSGKTFTAITANLPALPEGWVWARTDQMFWFVTSGSRGWAEYYSETGPLFLRIGNLDHDSISLDLREMQ